MRFVWILLLLVSCAYGRPNVVLIIADDFGAEACYPYGCDTNLTPNIDSLSTDGMRFTHMNAAQWCNPSRQMLFVGRDMGRIDSLLVGGGSPNIGSNEVCIASIMKNAGYKTGIFGKCDPLDDSTQPDNNLSYINYHGFETAVIWNQLSDDGYKYDDAATESEYIEYVCMTNVLDFIETNQDEEFFLIYSPFNPHAPFHSPPIYPPASTTIDKWWLQVRYVDYCVSNILNQVESLELSSNTVVIFTGDNGNDPSITVSFDGTPVQGGKFTNDEKAYRVPFYVRWPGQISAGTTYGGVTAFYDIAPTIAEIGETSMRGGFIVDGISFLDQLLGDTNDHRRIMSTIGISSQQYSKSNTLKIINDSGSLEYYTDNWPYGDATNAVPSHRESIDYIGLSYGYTNFSIKAYGDRAWYGSTNEFILQIP